MTMSGAVMETSKEVEGGLAYKDMREAGIDDDVARRLSGTVGFVNGSLEAIGDAVLTKFGGKLLGITGFKQMFGQKVKEKLSKHLKADLQSRGCGCCQGFHNRPCNRSRC